MENIIGAVIHITLHEVLVVHTPLQLRYGKKGLDLTTAANYSLLNVLTFNCKIFFFFSSVSSQWEY